MDSTATTSESIWIVTPCYHDVPSFLRLREEIICELSSRQTTAAAVVRFVVVDDAAGQDPDMDRLTGCEDVDVVVPPFNLGHQRGLVFGLRTQSERISADDLVLTLDADGEDRPEDIPRLLDALVEPDAGPARVVLAARTRRQESAMFKVFYRLFKVLFRILTGTTIQSGNFAAYRGSVVHSLLHHPYFDLCYSSTFISLRVPVVFVDCPRGNRYAGRSRMDRERLILHGLRMLMPFMDRIALRALGGLATLVAAMVVFHLVLLGLWVFTDVAISEWLLALGLALVIAALLGIVCCVILFALFAQSGGISLSGLEEAHGERSRRTSAER